MKLCFEIIVYQVFWPWIVYRWLWQATKKFWNEHFDHCHTYLIILQMINRCPISNFCLDSTSTFFNFFFVHMCTNPNLVVFCKIAVDMDMLTWCKWKNFVSIFFYGSFQLQNKTELNTQHKRCLETCLLHDIYVVLYSYFAFKSSITNIGCHWTIWFLLASSKQLHMPKWLLMAKQLHLS